MMSLPHSRGLIPRFYHLFPIDVGKTRKHKWHVWFGGTHAYMNLDGQTDLERYLSAELHPYSEDFDILG